MSALLGSLTDEQIAAVTAEGTRIHVSAPPGSGKTRVLARRAAWLIDQGVDPDQICCLTFTRSACTEIRSRVREMVDAAAERVAISTFHERALVDGLSLGGRTIATEEEEQAARDSLRSGPASRPSRDLVGVKELEKAIHFWEATAGLGTLTPKASMNVALVLQRLDDAGTVPTWHLLPMLRVAHDSDTVRTYEHVLCDESQDCTPAEIDAAIAFAGPNGCVFTVGDLRQAIMGWRYAEPSAWFPVTHRLTRTFRFGVEIAEAANELDVGDKIQGREDVDSVVLETWDLPRPSFFDDYDGSTAVLVRTHADAEAVAAIAPDLLRHVWRDPLDALSSPSDRIAAVVADGFVPVLTVHGAKGREFDRVVVIGPSTIAWGRASSDPEELRVLYVAMTRAREELTLIAGDLGFGTWRVKACGISGR